VPRRRDVAGPDQRHPASDAVLELQRLAGNQVARRLLGPAVAAPAPVVQRAPYGLDVQTSQDTYVAAAADLWKNRPDMPIDEFVAATLKIILAEHKAVGVPAFTWTFVSGKGPSGVFDSRAWQIKVNVSKFSSRLVPKILKDLTPAELTEVVGTLYHEARHADQDVLVVRTLLDQRKTPKQVVAATGIHKDVVKKVSGTKFAAAVDPDQKVQAGLMFDVMYGTHRQFLDFLMKHPDTLDVLEALAAPRSTFSAAAPLVKALTTWHPSVLVPKVNKLKALTSPTPVEAALAKRLEDLEVAYSDLLSSWKRVAAAKTPDPVDVADTRDAARSAKDAFGDVYQNLESEADAARVEARIKTAFAARLAKP